MKSIFLLLISSVSSCYGANILGIFTSNGPSHLIVHMATVRVLAERGHNVTVVTTLPLKERHPNYHHIQVAPSKEDDEDYRRKLGAAASGEGAFDSFKHLVSANVQRVRMQDKALSHPRFKELLDNEGNHFDLVILGVVFNTFQLGVAAHFKCPVIVSWVNIPLYNFLSLVGNPQAIASVPVFLPKSNSQLSFRARVRNFLLSTSLTAMDLFSEHKMAQYYEEHFPADRYPSYDEMKKNVSLVFCNTHFSEGIIRPMVPGFIEIGGIQVKERPDPLPKDIHQFLKSSDNGFIIFSLGSNVKSSDLSANTTLAIFNVLSRVQHKVIWKWDSGTPPGRAANILFRKWLPQDDLLANINARLFITHAGKGSVAEAQFHGVPMLAIPIYGDQFSISERIKDLGHGLIVDHRKLTEATFERHLQELMENDSYTESVLDFSMLYRDRPMSARQSVVYWSEYVIRYRGARHIQSPAVHLNFFQRNSLDVVGFLIFLICLGLVALNLLVSILCCKVSKKKIKRN